MLPPGPAWFRRGIRRRLLALALGLAVPLAGVAGVRAYERWRAEEAVLADRSLQTARRAAQLLDEDIENVQTLLSGTARLLAAENVAIQSDTVLRSVFRGTSRRFANLWIADSTGRITASLSPYADSAQRTTVGDRAHFRDAMRTRDFVIGLPVRSRIVPGAPFVLPFGMPIGGDSLHAPRGVLGASMHVDSLSAVQLMRDLPVGSVLTVLYADGRVYLRSQDLEKWIGRTFAADPELKQGREFIDRALPVRSLDGTDRLVGRAALRSIDALVYVGVPSSATLRLARRHFFVDLVVGLGFTLVVLVFALVMARRISDPLISLTDVANALTRGEQDRRADVLRDDEIGVLASAFNQLADTVRDRERAAEESNARYRELFATNPLPMVTWRVEDGRIEQVNEAARHFYGASRVEGEHARMLDLLDTTERERFLALALPASDDTIPAGIWLHVDAAGQLREVEMFLSALSRNTELTALGVMLDRTERRRAQEELELSREQLRQSQKMEALGLFAGGIAHDFNNYLAAISSNAEMLRDDLPTGSLLREEASEILSASQRAAALTRQILVFSRRQVLTEERLDINTVLREIERLLVRLLGEQIALQLECAPRLPAILFDRGRFEQAVMNLAANARDAMPDGGTLRIVTSADEDGVRLVVEDTGEGIDADMLPRIFEPFFTTKERGRGTGLGLAMVYSIVTDARGRVEVQSEKGIGTRFTITFPSGLGVLTPRDVPAVDADEARGTERLLLVEDDEAVRTSTAAILQRAGYRVTSVASGPEALALLGAGHARPDLLLTDVVMPEMSGPALAEQVRQRFPGLPVLFMSGFADDDAVMDGIERQAVHFLAKPFRSADLRQAIRSALRTAVPN